ncbi:LysE family translocator [Reinekea thalattae]|uniref:LysE family translocator n=1 Tax=Reinekea thalattae TaxID=2593301 RepID=A0A5C8ZC38_9GAMM|nr:LysE family translocator [Reinekea thalattae]TXR54476.1 LysE family translocator [Reinekea thalattae]
MNEYIIGLLLTYVAVLLALLTPGPNLMGILTTTLERGRAAGTLFGVGIAMGSLTWSILTVVGLTHFIASYDYVLWLIKLLGGAYLIYIGYKVFKASSEQEQINESLPAKKLSEFFVSGYLLMMTNPKSAFGWLAIASLSIYKDSPTWVAASVIGGTFILSFITHSSFALVFSCSGFLKVYNRCRRPLLKASSLIYCLLGVKLLMFS